MKWKSARVCEVADQVRGVAYSKQDASDSALPGYLPVLRAGNITTDGLTFDDLVYVPSERISKKQRVRRNDIVIAASSGSLEVVGKAARSLADFEGGFGAFCKILRPSDAVDPGYFAQYFKTKEYRRKVSSLAEGANINNLRNGDLDNLEIPLPPLAEQKRIAGILDAADALRAKRRAAIAQLDALAQSLFLDLFGDPVTNPRGWEVGTLDQLGAVVTGSTPPSRLDGMFDGEIPFITPGDLLEGWTKSKRTVTESGAKNSRTVRRGATLVCCIGATIGKMGKAADLSAFNQQINAISWNSRIVDNFGFEMMRFFKAKIAADGASTTLPILKKSLFQKISVIAPPLPLQQSFAAAVEAIEKQKARHREHLAGLDALFASLQHRAFRGEL